jgi:hypothetical protein
MALSNRTRTNDDNRPGTHAYHPEKPPSTFTNCPVM